MNSILKNICQAINLKVYPKKKVMACLLDEPCFQPKDFPQRQFRLREIFYDLSDDLFIDVRVISQMDFRV